MEHTLGLYQNTFYLDLYAFDENDSRLCVIYIYRKRKKRKSESEVEKESEVGGWVGR